MIVQVGGRGLHCSLGKHDIALQLRERIGNGYTQRQSRPDPCNLLGGGLFSRDGPTQNRLPRRKLRRVLFRY